MKEPTGKGANNVSVGKSGQLTGQVIGRYKVGNVIGRGGMAQVYIGEQTNIKRQVAIKVLHSYMAADDTFVKRFEREVQTIANLQHPRVLPVYDFGKFDDVLYIVMAYMAGGTLEAVISADKLSTAKLMRYTRQIAEGLDYAHRYGIIHRDLKPGNMLLDAENNLHLSDFGIAHISKSTTALTGSSVVGTPSYMAPEMFEGGKLTTATDIYALGITIYEMLAGVRPFVGETPAQVMLGHLTQAIPNVRTVRPELPEAIEYVVQKSLAKDPRQRYQNAIDLAKDLENALAGRDVVSRTSPIYDTLLDQSRSIDNTTELPPEQLGYEGVNTQPLVEPARPPSQQATKQSPVVISAPAEGKPRKNKRSGSDTFATAVIGLLALMLIGVGVLGILMPDLFTELSIFSEPTATAAPVTETTDAGPAPTATTAPTAIGAVEATASAAVPTNDLVEPTLGPTATPDPLAAARTRIERNAGWTPVIQTFANVDMALVPIGCFTMGDAGGRDSEKPIFDICIQEPFWIDVTEVTNQDFGPNPDAFPGPQRPANAVDWFEAQRHCEARGGRLPAEDEWEWAARGPDSLEYPWGNTFDGDQIFHDANAGAAGPGDVGTRGGASWVGAVDMSGNVWEWTLSRVSAYPYNPDDGRESLDIVDNRILRGGAFSQDAYGTRASVRTGLNPGGRDGQNGFRCLIEIQ